MANKRLFYDIETSFCEGHFWRPGYGVNILPHQVFRYAQIISISWKWEGGKEVHHLDWGLNKQCDKQLVKKFIKVLNKADEIVAHNGDRFDIKWIRTRAVFHDLEMRDTYTMIDTLKICKKYLALPSNTLAEVSKYFQLPNKKDAGGIATWIDIVVGKKQEALDHMHFYCDGDVVTLEAVFNKLKPYIRNKSNYAIMKGGAKFSCPECGSNNVAVNKKYTTAAGTIQLYMRCEQSECHQQFKINNKTYMDLLQYRILSRVQ